MDAKQFFLERYRGFQEYPTLLADGMSEQQLRCSPQSGVNPILWILWHTARCEDVGINRLIADRKEVLDHSSWPTRLGMVLRHIGTGMAKSEVNELCLQLNISELLAYRTAITERTEDVIAELAPDELLQELTSERLQKVFVEEGAGGVAADQIAVQYHAHTKGWLLGHLALTHNYYHIGQAFAARAMFGMQNPW
jgi:hypothetical protein